MSIACPICGDPNAYPFWVTGGVPEGCPNDDVWHKGGPVTIKNVTECQWQMAKAWQAAEFRKLVPDAFDETGTIKPGRIVDVLAAFGDAHPEKALTL